MKYYRYYWYLSTTKLHIVPIIDSLESRRIRIDVVDIDQSDVASAAAGGGRHERRRRNALDRVRRGVGGRQRRRHNAGRRHQSLAQIGHRREQSPEQ